MKKTKILAFVLVLSLMMVGAGYAFWTQDLKINTTVSTGDLNVEFVPLDKGLSEWQDKLYEELPEFGDLLDLRDYMDVEVVVDENGKLVANFNDVYPGAGGFLRFRIGNTGTVPATVTEIIGTPHEGVTETQLDNFDYVINSVRVYTPKDEAHVTRWGLKWGIIPYPIEEEFSFIDLQFPEGADVIYASTFDEFVNELEELLKPYTLEPFAFYEINGHGSGYEILLPPDIEDTDGMEGLESVGFDLDITYTQGE